MEQNDNDLVDEATGVRRQLTDACAAVEHANTEGIVSALAGVSACSAPTTVVGPGCVSMKGEGQITNRQQRREGDEP